jgi:hypothetical protein
LVSEPAGRVESICTSISNGTACPSGASPALEAEVNTIVRPVASAGSAAADHVEGSCTPRSVMPAGSTSTIVSGAAATDGPLLLTVRR